MPVSHLIDDERPTVINGDFAVVRDLSVQVERGEPYAPLGTNGAGKASTHGSSKPCRS
jgi:ABC-2 type transport system ATP-binding protein